MQSEKARLVDLINTAVLLKRAEQFEAAIDAYKQAVAIDPAETMCYYGIAKVFYLLGDQEMSVKCYTVTQHLSLIYTQANVEQHGIPLPLTVFPIPQALFSRVISTHPWARLMLADGNTPRHLGHALIDLGDSSSSHSKSVQAYRRSLLGHPESIPDAKERKYFVRGIEYLLNHIKWEVVQTCPKEEVAHLYGLSPDELVVRRA